MKKLILLSILFIVGCDSPTEDNETNEIIGFWNAIEIRRTNNLDGFIDFTDENHYYKFVFNQDGSMSGENGDLDSQNNFIISSSIGTWILNNANQITITSSNTETGSEFSYSYYFTLNNNSLILSTVENYEHGVTDGMYFICQRD